VAAPPVNAPVLVYQRSAVIAAQWVPIRGPACTNLAGYIANHAAGQQYSGYYGDEGENHKPDAPQLFASSGASP
jgi:hypothetical protein